MTIDNYDASLPTLLLVLIVGALPVARRSISRPVCARGSKVDDIQRRGHLRAGVMFDLPDFLYRHPKTGRVSGMEAEIIRHLVQNIFGGTFGDADERIEFVGADARGLETLLCEGQVDVVLANFADTPQRRRTISFAGHYLSSSHSPLVGADAPSIASLADLNGLRVAVGDGSTDVDTLLRAAPRAEPVPLSFASDCIQAVVEGRAEAYWTSRANAPGYIRVAGAFLQEAPVCLRETESWAVAHARGDTVFGAFIDEVVTAVLGDGLLNTWLRRSFGSAVAMGPAD